MDSDKLAQVKLIILYMLGRVDFLMTAAQISDFVLGRDYADYMLLTQAQGELIENGLISNDVEIIDEEPGESEELKDVSVRIKNIRFAVVNGSTWIYIKSDKGELFKAKVADDESVMLLEEGEKYIFSVKEADEKGIREFKVWKITLD